MSHFSCTVKTPWDLHRAFAYLADLSNYAQWDPSMKRSVQVEGDGPGVGARYELTVGRSTLTYEITELDPVRKVVAESHGTVLTSIDSVRVEPDGDGALVTYDADLTLNGPLGLADPLLSLYFHRLGDRGADGLARKLDGERVSTIKD